MAPTCCNLVGNFDISLEGIVSISSKGNTDVQLFSAGGYNVVTVAPSTGTVSIQAYASTNRHIGCAAKADVAIPWIQKSDCEKFIYLFGGAGKSTITGPAESLAQFPNVTGITNPVTELDIINASSSSGPATLYDDHAQRDGYGLVYKGSPWFIDTTNKESCTINLTDYGIGGYGVCYLQNLSVSFNPGQLPMVDMSFIYSITN